MNLETRTTNKEATAYEAPTIESVLTSEELEREVAYAGSNQVSPPPNGPTNGTDEKAT